MELGFNNAKVIRPDRKTGAPLAAALVFLLSAFLLTCSPTAAAENREASRFPAITIYEGSG